MSRIYIVDENDNVIEERDEKLPEDVGSDDIYRVSTLWVVDPTSEKVLIAQRGLKKWHNPGKWGPSAAGTVEVGETYEQNITKEAAEEIGLTNVEFLPIRKHLHSSDHKYFCQDFLAKCDWPIERFKLQADEVEQIRWIGIDELAKDLIANPGNYTPKLAESLEFLQESLGKVKNDN